MSKHVGAVRAKDAKVLPVGAFVEGELYLSWMHFFQAHSCLLFFLLFYLFIFVQELIRGHYPSVVTSGDSVTHKYFHRNERLARDETPFPWPCNQGSLPWRGNQLMAMPYC
jgi:hypothetical protein